MRVSSAPGLPCRPSMVSIGTDSRPMCAELLPELIELDDWGYPVLRAGDVPPELMTKARWAVKNCPALALRLGS